MNDNKDLDFPGRVVLVTGAGFVVIEQSTPARANRRGYNNVITGTPAGRWDEPKNIAGGVLFLAPPLAGFITGVVLPVDGGYSVV